MQAKFVNIRFLLIAGFLAVISPASAAPPATTRWDCRVDGWSGEWDIQGHEVIGPMQDIVDVRPHFLILKNASDFLVAADAPDGNAADVMTVILNKKSLTVKIDHLIVASNIVDSENGTCKPVK